MPLSREDKIWLSQLAGLVINAVNEIVCSPYKTMVAVDRVKDVLRFGRDDTSKYMKEGDGFGDGAR